MKWNYRLKKHFEGKSIEKQTNWAVSKNILRKIYLLPIFLKTIKQRHLPPLSRVPEVTPTKMTKKNSKQTKTAVYQSHQTCEIELWNKWPTHIQHAQSSIIRKINHTSYIDYHECTMSLYFLQTFSIFFKHKPSIPIC
jgi:hypothetical protein